MTARGYIKTVAVDAFRAQGRGGRGVTGARLGEEDYIRELVQTTNKSYLLFFTNRGRVYRLKAYRIPRSERTSRGTAIVNLLQLQEDEKVQAVIDTQDYETHKYLMFVTANGVVKKTPMAAYDTSLKAGLIAISLREGDELVRVLQTSGADDILMVTRNGRGIRFSEQPQERDLGADQPVVLGVRPMGRTAAGVRGMRLVGDDRVVAADVADESKLLLTITENGFGKRTPTADYSLRNRGGQGVRSHRVNDRVGKVVAALLVGEDEQILMVSDAGIVIRTPVASVASSGRDAMGVRVMRVGEAKIAAVAVVVQGDEDADTPEGEESDLATAAVSPGAEPEV
jgi:DNA gyrase subunit A